MKKFKSLVIFVFLMMLSFAVTVCGAGWTAANTGLNGAVVNVLAIDPSKPQTVYAGTSNGVFKSTDGGRNWISINQGMVGTVVESLAINPKMPEILYAGTTGIVNDWKGI